MKKALLIAYIYNVVDFEFVNGFTLFLKNRNFTVVTISSKFGASFYKEGMKDENDYDLIFLINTNRSNSSIKKIPKICIVNSTKYFQFWDPDNLLPFWYYGNKMNIISSYNYFYIPFSDNLDNSNILKQEQYDFLFIFFESTTLLNLLRFINLLNDKKIAVLDTCKNINRNLFNMNVSFVAERDFDKVLLSSKIVIGEGVLITKAVLLLKPTIVVGKNGYGGVLSEKNILNQFYNNYSGRIGGAIEEFTPLNLLQLDIEELNSKSIEELKQIKIILQAEIEKENFGLEKKIDFFIRNNDNNILSFPIVRNVDYSYFLYSSLNQYIVIHSATNKLLYQIPIEEYKLIKEFDTPKIAEAVISQLKTKKLPEQKLIRIIKKLVKYNLLQHTPGY